jgi:hypothetical protein
MSIPWTVPSVLEFKEAKLCIPIHCWSRVCCSRRLLCSTTLDEANPSIFWMLIHQNPTFVWQWKCHSIGELIHWFPSQKSIWFTFGRWFKGSLLLELAPSQLGIALELASLCGSLERSVTSLLQLIHHPSSQEFILLTWEQGKSKPVWQACLWWCLNNMDLGKPWWWAEPRDKSLCLVCFTFTLLQFHLLRLCCLGFGS